MEAIIAQLRLYNQTISGKADGKSFVVPFKDIYYFDTADRRTFLYTASDVYECALKLYQIEDRLEGTPFIRVNKSTILNLKKVDCVEGSLSGRLTASLLNGEKVEISRMYVPDVKAKLEIK